MTKFIESLTKAITSLKDIDVQNGIFWLLVIAMACSTLIVVVGKLKGEKPFFSELLNTLGDMLRYTFGERNGRSYQKLNYGLFVLFGIAFLCFLLLSCYAVLNKLPSANNLLIIFISVAICLLVLTPLCMKFTRYRA